MKTKSRNRLHVCSDIHLAASTTEPNIKASLEEAKSLFCTDGDSVCNSWYASLWFFLCLFTAMLCCFFFAFTSRTL